MKFTVIVARYAITGVPLAQARLASALAARGHEVDLLVGFVAEGLPVPEVDGVTVIHLNRPKARQILFDMVKYLRKRKPDAIFSAEDHLNAIVIASALLSGSKAKITGSSRVNPFDTYSQKVLSKRWFLKQITAALMWRANVLTCVSKAMVDQYRTLFRNAPHVCVYNIVDTPAARARIAEPVDHPWFTDRSIPVLVAAGQLGPWKGFSDLIAAVHIVAQKRPVRLAQFCSSFAPLGALPDGDRIIESRKVRTVATGSSSQAVFWMRLPPHLQFCSASRNIGRSVCLLEEAATIVPARQWFENIIHPRHHKGCATTSSCKAVWKE